MYFKLNAILFLIISIFFNNAYAEYYLVYSSSEPLAVCTPCVYSHPQKYKHQKYKKTAHRRSTYRIEVYYVWDPYSLHPCQFASKCNCCYDDCYEKVPRREMSYDYVNFSYEPTSYYRTTSSAEEYDSYDMRTADDDAMRYPDVNNQY